MGQLGYSGLTRVNNGYNLYPTWVSCGLTHGPFFRLTHGENPDLVNQLSMQITDLMVEPTNGLAIETNKGWSTNV